MRPIYPVNIYEALRAKISDRAHQVKSLVLCSTRSCIDESGGIPDAMSISLSTAQTHGHDRHA